MWPFRNRATTTGVSAPKESTHFSGVRAELNNLIEARHAGAFGAHISSKHAMVLGMIPDVPLDKVFSAGNAAGTGARIALCNVGSRREIERVVGEITKVETAIEPKFQDHFVAANAIPHKTAPFPELRSIVTLPNPNFNAGGVQSNLHAS